MPKTAKTTHSPLPWNIFPNADETWTLETEKLESLGIIRKTADADYIDKAVNLHAKLVEALEAEHFLVVEDMPGGWEGNIHTNFGRKQCSVCALLKEAKK